MRTADQIQKDADSLARTAERKLCESTYRCIIGEHLVVRKSSELYLLIAAGSLGLLIPNLRDLLEISNLSAIRWALGYLLFSGLLGVGVKFVSQSVQDSVSPDSSVGSEYAAIFADYFRNLKPLQTEAASAGEEVKVTLDVGAMFEPANSVAPGSDRWILRELDAREKDVHYKWKPLLKKAREACWWNLIQLLCILLAFGVLLFSLHDPAS